LQLLAGTAALLLHWPADRPQQERCTYAGLWRNCLRVSAQARSGGSSSSRVGLQATVQQLLARMPAGAVWLSNATQGVSWSSCAEHLVRRVYNIVNTCSVTSLNVLEQCH
jgi:hypothetical protein